MRKLLLAGLISGFAISTANAVPLFNGELYGGYISQDPSGWLQYKGTPVDLEKDLGFDEEGSYFILFY